MATDTESMHENMTRLRMRMVQQKLANERERLQRPDSHHSDNGYDNQVKLQRAMLKRQELLDRIRQEQLDDKRPRTYSPRRRYTPSLLPPPSRRSMQDINQRTYHFGVNENQDMPSQVKHVIEHQFRAAPPQNYALPPVQAQPVPVIQAQPVPVIQAQPVPVIQQTAIAAPEVRPVQTMAAFSAYPMMNVEEKKSNTSFNKADFMDMMMIQNAQMHHMVMQQMMLQQLPGNGRPNSYPTSQAEPCMPMARPAPSVYHHHIQSQPYGGPPPMDYYQQGYGW